MLHCFRVGVIAGQAIASPSQTTRNLAYLRPSLPIIAALQKMLPDCLHQEAREEHHMRQLKRDVVELGHGRRFLRLSVADTLESSCHEAARPQVEYLVPGDDGEEPAA